MVIVPSDLGRLGQLTNHKGHRVRDAFIANEPGVIHAGRHVLCNRHLETMALPLWPLDKLVPRRHYRLAGNSLMGELQAPRRTETAALQANFQTGAYLATRWEDRFELRPRELGESRRGRESDHEDQGEPETGMVMMREHFNKKA